MPLLKAKPEEKKKEFITRCMGDPGMNKEFPNEKQRTAVCSTQWSDKKDEMDDENYICDHEDGETETEDQRKAKNAVNNGLKSGKVKKPDKCDKCGTKGSLEAHHKNGYDEKNMLNIIWLCKPCHKDLHVKLRKKKKMPNKDEAYRIDFYPWDDLGDMPDSYKFKKNLDTGFLEGKAIVTNVGVFPYLMEDGSIRHELRPPEEVFNHDSMQTLKMKPITNDHPDEAVTSENIKDFQVGSTGNDVLQDQYHLAISLVINDAATIEDVELGKRGLSQGYKADIEEKSGVWMGMAYDAIQRNIRYNHTAIVERGRAGDDAVMKFDSLDYGNVGVHHIDNKNFNEKGESFMPLKKFKMDGVEYEAEAPVIAAYTRLDKENTDLKAENEKLKKDQSTLEADRDQFKDDAEKLKGEAEKKADVDPEKFEKAVQGRIVVHDAARRAGVEIKKDQSEIDLKKDIIISVYPKSKDTLDKAEDNYVDARFDAVLERLDEIKDDQDNTNTNLRNDSLKNHDKDKDKKEDTSESAYDRSVKRDTEAYLRGKEDK